MPDITNAEFFEMLDRVTTSNHEFLDGLNALIRAIDKCIPSVDALTKKLKSNPEENQGGK